MENLEIEEPELADEIRKKMFVFEDILLLDDRAIQRVLREVDNNDLAIALKGANEQVQNAIFNNLSKRMAMTFCGLRIDSGVEEEQVDLIVEKYKQLGIDPMTKQAVFSNGLDIDRAIEIHRYCQGKITDSYGVGTFITCDVTGCKPMNIVVKLIRGRITESREWHPCVKLSCDKGKTLGDPQKCNYLLSILERNDSIN